MILSNCLKVNLYFTNRYNVALQSLTNSLHDDLENRSEKERAISRLIEEIDAVRLSYISQQENESTPHEKNNSNTMGQEEENKEENGNILENIAKAFIFIGRNVF